jgi:hypothetical protein
LQDPTLSRHSQVVGVNLPSLENAVDPEPTAPDGPRGNRQGVLAKRNEIIVHWTDHAGDDAMGERPRRATKVIAPNTNAGAGPSADTDAGGG